MNLYRKGLAKWDSFNIVVKYYKCITIILQITKSIENYNLLKYNIKGKEKLKNSRTLKIEYVWFKKMYIIRK